MTSYGYIPPIQPLSPPPQLGTPRAPVAQLVDHWAAKREVVS